MNIIKPSIMICDELNEEKILEKIELSGRVCYKSESFIKDGSAKKFIKNIINMGHESVIEHEKITVKIICDRGVSHEIVRHRIASYSQESTRYCNYTKDKFGNELTFIEPNFFNTKDEKDIKNKNLWLEAMQNIENLYNKMMTNGAKPEEARSILPNSLKTEIMVTMNMRAWRHFLKLRTDKSAHPQIREVSNMILNEFKKNLPTLFDDL